MELGPRSMASVWLAGIEDEPQRSGEICLFEIFGDALDGGESAAVGMGIKPFRDPVLTWDFEAPRLPIDVREPHVYAADWSPGRVAFSVDGELVRSRAGAGLPGPVHGRGVRLPGQAGPGRPRAAVRGRPRPGHCGIGAGGSPL